MILPKINKFSKDFLDTLKAQGASEENLKLLRRMRGISISEYENLISLNKNTWTGNITFQYDYLIESENENEE